MDKTCRILVLLVLLSSGVIAKLSPRIYFLHVNSDIKYRFSTTVITSKVVNPATEASEALFDVTLPDEAFITEFKLIINGTEHKGNVKEKEQAKQEYDQAKSRGQNAGHIVSKPRDSNKFQIQVNVAAAEKVTFELSYRELLRRRTGNYEQTIYINPRQIVDDFRVDVSILEYRNITTLNVPPLRNDILTEAEEGENKDARIVRLSANEVRISYSLTKSQQEALSEQGVSGQLVVQYDIQRQNDSGEVLVMDGYFVHYLSPDGLKPTPMDIVFILDRSGSMMGNKIKQLQESMFKILDEIDSQDRFLLLAFDNTLKYWRSELAQATASNIADAKQFITSIGADGSTDINLAMTEGLKILSKETGDSHAPVIVFLTDGQPTSGVTNSMEILENVKLYNEIHIPIFSLAFGQGADYDFTKKVAAQNNGLGKKIYEDSDAALQISGFYKEISTVLMRNVSFNYLDGSLNDSTLTQTNFNTYFNGSELIVAGKINNLDKLRNGIQVSAKAAGNRDVSLSRPLICVLPPSVWPLPGPSPTSPPPPAPSMMENLWAYLTIKQLLRKKEGLDDKEEIKKIDQKILDLSLKYQFVTPLTSMVVTLPNDTKTTLNSDQLTVDDSLGLSGLGNSRQKYFSPGSARNTYAMMPRYVFSALPKRDSGPRGHAGLPQEAVMFLKFTQRPFLATSTAKSTRRTTKASVGPGRTPTFLVNVSSVSLCFDLPFKRSRRYNIINMVKQKHGCAVTANTTINLRKASGSPLSSAEIKMFKGRRVQKTYSIDASQLSQNIQCNMDGINLDVNTNGGVHVQADIHGRQRKSYIGILSRFANMKCKAVKQVLKRGKLVVKIKCRRRGFRTLKLKTVQRTGPSGETCFFLNRKMTNLLGINPENYEVNS